MLIGCIHFKKGWFKWINKMMDGLIEILGGEINRQNSEQIDE